MKRTLLAFAIAALVATPLGAWAEEKEGKVTKWETTTRTITFDDGSTYVVTETVKTESLKEGSVSPRPARAYMALRRCRRRRCCAR